MELRWENEACLKKMQKIAKDGNWGTVASKGEKYGREMEICFTFLYNIYACRFSREIPVTFVRL
jgi:hypothetical protein